MWKVFSTIAVLALGVLISENMATSDIRPQSSRGFVFPNVSDSDECFLDEAQQKPGICKNIADCYSALMRWKEENIRPKTCYFNKFDHIVCCEQKQLPTQPQPQPQPLLNRAPADTPRRSEEACTDFHIIKGPPGSRVAIVRGVPTGPDEFPFMAALGWKSNFDDTLFYRCGGAVIAAKFILTAAHCTEFGGEFPSVARVGGTNLTDGSGVLVPIKRVIVHPRYDVTTSYHDLALLELDKDSGVIPACVWSQHAVEHNNVTALGYGSTSFAGVSSDQLLKAPLFLVSNEVCQRFYTGDIDLLPGGLASTQICAGDPEHLRDTCQGDSGGPLILKVDRGIPYFYVVGITSFGQGCAGEPPSIYTRISSYIDWIEEIVWPADSARK